MKKLIWVIILIVIIGLVWWMLASEPATAPTTNDITPPAPQTESDQINSDLNAVTDVNFDSEFSDIDKDAVQLKKVNSV